MPVSQNRPAVTEALKYGESDNHQARAEPIGGRQCGNEHPDEVPPRSQLELPLQTKRVAPLPYVVG